MAFEVTYVRSDMGETYDVKGLKVQTLSPMFYGSTISTSLFTDHACLPSERQVGFWKPEAVPYGHLNSLASSTSQVLPPSVGFDAASLLEMANGNRSADSLMNPLKNGQNNWCSNIQQWTRGNVNKVEMAPGSRYTDPSLSQPKAGQAHWSSVGQEWPRGQFNKMTVELDTHVTGLEKNPSLLSTSWAATPEIPGMNGVSHALASSAQSNLLGRINSYHGGGENRFSSSVPALLQNKLRLSTPDTISGETFLNGELDKEYPFDLLEELEWQTIGSILPDDDELFSSVVDDLDSSVHANTAEENEDFDLFSSGGGMELESDAQDSLGGSKNNSKLVDASAGGSTAQHGSGSVAGEHPYGEHPSRTLFVRNINSNVEDTELRALFEQYGAIRTLYTACKHRGFVMISYYDIRAARSAMRALQNKPLRRRKLDIHFSIPKDNPSDKDVNQGTLVVFNLDASVSNDDLRQIFGVYGEVKEIRETPHKRHHKFIEFYDVRSAEAALRALNRCDIAGKRIKLEPSRPGGARRSIMQQLTQELEQEEQCSFRQLASSPLTKSPPGHAAHRGPSDSYIENATSQNNVGNLNSLSKCLNGVAATVSPCMSSPVRVGALGSHLAHNGPIEACQTLGYTGLGVHQSPHLYPHTFSEFSNGVMNSAQYSPSVATSALAAGLGSDQRHFQKAGTSSMNNVSLFEPSNSGNRPLLYPHTNPTGSLPGHGILCSSLNSLYHKQSPQMMWPPSPVGPSYSYNGQIEHPSYADLGLHGHLVTGALSSQHHHIGSAPITEFSVLDRHHGYLGETLDASSLIMASSSLGALGLGRKNGMQALSLGSHSRITPGTTFVSNGLGDSLASPSPWMMPQQHRGRLFSNIVHEISPAAPEWVNERGRARKSDNGTSQNDKKQYQLDLDRILRGEDNRTTLMIKNIPNKYTSKMLLAAIDEHHRGTYDFIYLPIDFKNKCNVGYAFINMTNPARIVPFFQAFNGKKWEKFNSEKVASLAYARIQGKTALVAHFQNSSLMNEDKRCRPILFHSGGPHTGDQEPFPIGANPRTRMSKSRGSNGSHQGSPTSSSSKDESLHGSESVL